MRLYLDNCCYNRPFDDQKQLSLRMETDAKLLVQESIRTGECELVWSFVLDYENGDNPHVDARRKIAEWKQLAIEHVGYSDAIRDKASELMKLGLRQKDASHIACALQAGCVYFLTTDKKILNKVVEGIELINPIDYVRRQEDAI